MHQLCSGTVQAQQRHLMLFVSSRLGKVSVSGVPQLLQMQARPTPASSGGPILAPCLMSSSQTRRLPDRAASISGVVLVTEVSGRLTSAPRITRNLITWRCGGGGGGGG